MTTDLNAAIQERIARTSPADVSYLASAVLAVADKCEQMRAESAEHPGGVGHFFAAEFEQTIARALGITA